MVAAVAAARRILTGPPHPTPDQRRLAALLLGEAARKWSLSGQGDVAIGWADEALAVAQEIGEPHALIVAMIGQTTSRIFTGTRGDAMGWLEEIARLATETGDSYSLAFTAAGVAGTLSGSDPALAERLVGLGVEAAHRTGNPHVIALAVMGQGRLLARAGRYAEARVRLQEGIDRFAEVGDERLVEAARSELAHTIRRAGQLDEAMAMYRISIHGWVRSGNRGAVAHQLENVAFVLIARGENDDAARLLGAAEVLRETAHSPMIQSEQIEYDEWVERLRTSADGADVDTAIAAGRALTMAEAVELAVGSA